MGIDIAQGMLELAGILSSAPMPRVITGWASIGGWIALLALACALVPQRFRLVLVAVASLLIRRIPDTTTRGPGASTERFA